MVEQRVMQHILVALRHPETLSKAERFGGTLCCECVETAVFRGLYDARTRIACCSKSHPL